MGMQLLPPARRSGARYAPVVDSTTLRNFDGGWNAVDNDMNLSPKYATELTNCWRDNDGSIALRNGTRWFADITSAVSGDILEIAYFASHIIVFTDEGEIAKITGAGVVTAIWNTTIAAALPGAPSGWTNPISFISYTQFKGELVCCNGIDKPILIDSDLAITYLQDLATSSNVNTPVGKYVTAVSEWVIMAGISGEESVIYISNSRSSGTWPLDNAPNDAASYDVGTAVSLGDSDIVGLASFRNKLLVMFSDVTVVVNIGDVSTGTHVPTIDDTLPQFGTISHRSVQNLGDDLLLADIVGVPSFRQASLTTSLEPDRASYLIDPEIQNTIASITTASQLERVFSVYHRLENQYLLFIPNNNSIASTTESTTFVYHYHRRRKIAAWSKYNGPTQGPSRYPWNWRAACRSDLGRVFLAEKDRIFVLGDEKFSDEFYADRKDDRDSTWANGTAYSINDLTYDSVTDNVWKCVEAHTSAAAGAFSTDRAVNPSYWEEYEGEEIAFAFEMPWADFKDRMSTKTLKYLLLDTDGNAQFTVDIFVDNLYFDPSDGVTRIPAVSLSLTGGESGGFGDGTQPFGGGRRTVDERPWPMPIKFKIMKLRFSGSTTASLGLQIVAISLGWAKGSLYR